MGMESVQHPQRPWATGWESRDWSLCSAGVRWLGSAACLVLGLGWPGSLAMAQHPSPQHEGHVTDEKVAVTLFRHL